MQPYISVVVTTRNDDHGGDLLRRMQIFMDGWIALARKHRLPSELIVVEWNPPPDRPRLRQALQWTQDLGPTDVRFIEVPPELHRRYAHAKTLPLYQMIAKNVGLRRSRGLFGLATNIDILFSDELVAFFAQRRLETRRMYRMDRYDVMRETPIDQPVDRQLAYCQTHLLRINERHGTFHMAPDGQRLLNDEDIAERNSGITFGPGWYPPEGRGSHVFRFVENDAVIELNPGPAPGPVRELVLDLSPGPSVRDQPFVLQILAEGQLQAQAWIRERSYIRLRAAPSLRTLKLHVESGGQASAPDPRVLNMIVHSCRWEPIGAAADVPASPYSQLSGSYLTSFRIDPAGLPRYAIGQSIDFNSGDQATIFLGPEWAPPDGQGCWSVGPHATIAMALDGAPQESTETSFVATFTVNDVMVDDANPHLNVAVTVNGRPAAIWRLGPSRIPGDWRVLVPPGALRPDRRVRISFEIDEPKSPIQLNWSDDSRPLGFKLRGFRIDRACPAKCAFGQVIELASSSHAHLGATQWAGPDGEGRWTIGPQAAVTFQLKEAARGRVRAEFFISGCMVDESAPDLRVRVTANGRTASEWVFGLADRAPHQRTVSLPEPIGDDSGVLMLAFEILIPRSPESLGWSDDRRPLGIRLERVVFTDDCSDVAIGPPAGEFGSSSERSSGIHLDSNLALGAGWRTSHWDASPDPCVECDREGEIRIKSPAPAHQVLRLEIAPVSVSDFNLEVRNADGRLLVEKALHGPQAVYLTVPPGDETQVLSVSTGQASLQLFGLSWCDPPRSMARAAPANLHINACGDFTLMAREHWMDLRGYPEIDTFSFNIDALFCYAAHYGGIRETMLTDPLRIYHIEHDTGSGWTPEGQASLFERLRAKGIDWIDIRDVLEFATQMRKLNSPIIFNGENWGLSKFELPE